MGTLTKDQQTRLSAAKLMARRMYPYFSKWIYTLVPVVTEGIGTFACDKYLRLYVDPEVVTSWTIEQQALVIVHEINHALRNHTERADAIAADHKLFNYAADAEINDNIIEDIEDPDIDLGNMNWPHDPMTPASLGMPKGLLAEEYYEKIKQQAQQQPGPGQSGKGGGSDGESGSRSGSKQSDTTGDGSGNASGSKEHKDPSDSSSGSDGGSSSGDSTRTGSDARASGGQNSGGDGAEGDAAQTDRPSGGSGNCGSVAGGPKREWERDAPGSGHGEPPGLHQTEQDLLRRQTAQEVLEHSRSRGKTPGWLVDWAKKTLAPKRDPKRELTAVVKNSVAEIMGIVDYTFRRRNRRQPVSDIILPGFGAPSPNVAVVVDTSGSMSDRQVKLALGWTEKALLSVGINKGVHLITCDADIGGSTRAFSKREIENITMRRGGTDMKVGIAHAMTLRPRPDIIVVLTDGETPWPDTRLPGVHMIVGLIEVDNPSYSTPPSWAKVIKIEAAT